MLFDHLQIQPIHFESLPAFPNAKALVQLLAVGTKVLVLFGIGLLVI